MPENKPEPALTNSFVYALPPRAAQPLTQSWAPPLTQLWLGGGYIGGAGKQTQTCPNRLFYVVPTTTCGAIPNTVMGATPNTVVEVWRFHPQFKI
jgi:hypothetical protein